MKRTAWILIFLLSVCAFATAQTGSAPECPTVSMRGPAGIVKKGEIAYYSANIGTAKQNYNLEFLWRIESGTIISGQGTTRVGIADVEKAQTVTLEVKGLPIGCPNTASEFASWCPAPQAEKLDQFSWPFDSTLAGHVKALEETAYKNANAQLYMIIPPDVKIRSDVIKAFEPLLRERNLEPAPVTFVEFPSKNNVIQVWLVPPGATPPSKCDGCETPVAPIAATPAPANCPTLEVTGPSGVTPRGTIMPFVVLVSEPRLRNLSFAWTVSTGTIAEGQGTRVIKVRAPAANGTKALIATVTVQGLPQGCRNVASDTAEIALTGGRISRDIYAFGQ